MQRPPIGLVAAILVLVIGLIWAVYSAHAAGVVRDDARRVARRAESALDQAHEALQRTEAFANAAWQAAPLAAGEVFFVSRGCATCHTVGGRHWTGPTMKDLYGSTVKFADGGTAVADLAFLEAFTLGKGRRSIAGFAPLMPVYEGQIDPGALRAIALYIMSLSAGHEEEARAMARQVQRDHLQSLMDAAAPAEGK